MFVIRFFSVFFKEMPPKRKIYSIILTNHGRQLRSLAAEETEKAAHKRFNSLLKESRENVVFPIEYNNHEHVMLRSNYEIVLIKYRKPGDERVSRVRDEYGRFREYEASDENWMVVERADYPIEETFWVYGFHPRLHRKTFTWVFENFIRRSADDKSSIRLVALYLNKIMVETDGRLQMVICKNKKDAIRFYNKLEEWCIKKRMKYVAFFGDVGASRHKSQWIDKIRKLTNWKDKKILRGSTRD